MAKKLIMLMMICTMFIVGCGSNQQSGLKQEIPEAKYTEAGVGIKGTVTEDGTVILTYALVGVKNNIIEYLYLDQIEQNPQSDRHIFTNKELQNAYGLSYTSDYGEWYQQVDVLETYILGNNMTLEDVKSIPTYEKDEKNKMVPKKDSDLGVACELDIANFIDVIDMAFANLQDVEAMRLAVGEDVRINKKNNEVDVQLAFVGTDYRYKISFAHLEAYEIKAETDIEIVSNRERAEGDEQYRAWNNDMSNFEKYIVGLNINEAIGVEVYDPGNGVDLALPKKGTDLSERCSIDLYKTILALREASDRLENQ